MARWSSCAVQDLHGKNEWLFSFWQRFNVEGEWEEAPPPPWALTEWQLRQWESWQFPTVSISGKVEHILFQVITILTEFDPNEKKTPSRALSESIVSHACWQQSACFENPNNPIRRLVAVPCEHIVDDIEDESSDHNGSWWWTSNGTSNGQNNGTDQSPAAGSSQIHSRQKCSQASPTTNPVKLETTIEVDKKMP